MQTDLRNAAVRLEVSRHDPHNIDLQITHRSCTAATAQITELFLFVPTSVSLHHWSPAELKRDFHSRLRLSLVDGEGYTAVTNSVARLRRTLEALEQAGGKSSHADVRALHENLVEGTKELGALVGDALVQLEAERRQVFKELKAHLLQANDATEIRRGWARLRLSLRRANQMLDRIRRKIPFGSLPETKSLDALQEYVGHLHVQGLGKLEAGADALPEFSMAKQRFLRTLALAKQREANARRRSGRGKLTPERHVMRMGHLKKYFQSRTFIDVSRQPITAKVTESSAAVGAFCAGVCGIVAEQFGRPDSLAASAGSLWLLAVPALIYVLKDRIKDWVKASVQRRATSWLADSERELVADGQRLGATREWFQLRDSSAVPEHVRHARSYSDDEAFMQSEGALYWRQEQKLEPISDSRWWLRETLRLNFERYLKFLDDPIKEVAMLEDDGSLVHHTSRRVYHFHLCVVTQQAATQIYRVVVDKLGVDRVECIYGAH